MKDRIGKLRLAYIDAFIIFLITEVLIALFIRDEFIRPYGGDILVTVLLCCFVRIIIPKGFRLLPLCIFLFAAAVEIGQYFDMVTVLGFAENVFMRTLLGSTFSIADLLCYAFGCILFSGIEQLIGKHKSIERGEHDV